jgi:hypothetical protein
MTAEIAAIIPTTDRAALLSTTLRRLLWQQDVELEAIVVDEGSSERDQRGRGCGWTRPATGVGLAQAVRQSRLGRPDGRHLVVPTTQVNDHVGKLG